MRVGFGFDAHRLSEGRPLVIGGVTIPHELGLAAHSDGDVLIHALCDALLGGAGLGDIGRHFPDTSGEFAGIDSRILLRRVVELLGQYAFSIANADLTIVAQQPKMAPHIGQMERNLAEDMQIDVGRVNVKATTTEGMGYSGRGEGIAAYATILLLEAG